MKILAYESNFNKHKAFYRDHQGEETYTSSVPEVLEFLLESQFDSNDRQIYPFRVCWNLDQFLAPLFRLMWIDYPDQVWEIVTDHKTKFQNMSFYYSPQKSLSIHFTHSHGRESVTYYDISQYYYDLVDHPEDIHDLKNLAEQLLHTLEKIGLHPSKLSSPAKIFEECILENLYLMPTAYDIPHDKRDIAKYAYYCTNRPWIECHRLGHWEQTWDYDIASAYPYQAMQLHSTHPHHCHIRYSNRTVEETATYGFMYGTITVNPEFRVSPIIRRTPDGKLQNNTGSWKDFMPLTLYRFMIEHELGSFRMEDGWFLYSTSERPPFRNVFERMFNYRSYNNLADKLAKRMMAGGLGKFIEHYRHGYGRFFNPIYSAQIQSSTTVQMARFLYTHSTANSLISINTDGCLLSEPVKLHEQPKPKPGQWKLTEVAPAFAIGSGTVIHGSKRPHGISYNLLKQQVDTNPNNSYYEINATRPVSIPDIADRKADISELATPKQFTIHSLDLTSLQIRKQSGDLDRHFPSLPKTGRDLLENTYQSDPIHIKE